MRDSLTPAQVDAGGCAVIAGDWYSRYDGITWSDPAELEIDHVVALKEAWDSGAWAWDDARLTAFGNDVDDVRSLVAVTGAENQAKSDKDPSNWIPSNPDAVCTYLADWTSIKARWGLSMDESEHGRIRNLLTDRCPGQTIAPWEPVPAVVATTPAPPAPAPVPAPPLAAVPASDCDPSYPTLCIPVGAPDLDCGDIPDRRFPVLPARPARLRRQRRRRRRLRELISPERAAARQYHAAVASPSRPVFDADTRAFLQRPVAIMLGSADQLNTPDAVRSSGIAVLDDRRLRVVFAADAATARANAVPGARVSLLVSDITTYESIQWKGTVVAGASPRTAGDLALTHAYLDNFLIGLEQNGMGPDLLRRLCSLDTVAIEVEIDEEYDQTPGVDAGRKVAG